MIIPKELRIVSLLITLVIIITGLSVYSFASTHIVYVHTDYIGQAGVKFPRLLGVPMPYIILGIIALLWICTLIGSLKDEEQAQWYIIIAIFGSINYMWFYARPWI